ncbi:PRC-barrel domain-containing protein [Paracoccus sp. T5]|uniref:PRC-barrel domain-containing protein n=1 Tax=Paracoccus sp. T5 TaxID=3402161 RepID=UPI003AEEFEF9
MKRHLTGLFAASLLSTTAVTAIAQQTDAPAADADMAEACQQLDQIVADNSDRFQQVWLDEAGAVAERGEDMDCAPYVRQAQAVEAQGADAQQIEGRIVVSQPPPNVNVQQPAPEVNVSQPEPTVSVTQPQPEIIVRQAPPTIRIEMPDPVVTVDQPQPEIIVRMPDPQVNVQTAEPQIEVNQAEPTVSVEQGEPQVDLAVQDTPEGEQEAQIQVDQQTPQVRLQQNQSDPQVNVEQAQPKVTYESAEPKVEFSGSSEPQVQYTESGEANVSFVEGGAEGEAQVQQQEGEQPMPVEGEAQATAQTDWRGERQPLTPPQIEREGYQPADPSTISVDTLMGADVYSETDENIGSVEDVMLSNDGQVEFFVMDVGGFLGIGSHTVALGLDEVTVMQAEGDELRVFVSATREQLEQAPEYEG